MISPGCTGHLLLQLRSSVINIAIVTITQIRYNKAIIIPRQHRGDIKDTLLSVPESQTDTKLM